MPRDSKLSLIQKIARQADITFQNCCDSNDFLVNLTELSALVNGIRAADLNITPPKDGSGSRGPKGASVTYMHICETRSFSMGVFVLSRGASIPLHDHPGMNGMLKVLYGKVRIRCFDKLDEQTVDPEADQEAGTDSNPNQRDSARLAVMRSEGEFILQSAPCVLSPRRDNLHQIDALDGPSAFLDILAPPYDPDHGRDCHYYRVLPTTNKNGNHKGEERAWLLEIPQPEDFWCGGEPYPGPKVTV